MVSGITLRVRERDDAQLRERELVPETQQSRYKTQWSAVRLCPSVCRRSIKQNNPGCKRLSAPSFAALFKSAVSCLGDILSTNTDGVKRAKVQV